MALRVRKARILKFRPTRRDHDSDRVDEDGFIIDDDEEVPFVYPFGRPYARIAMHFERGVSATVTISFTDLVRELERLGVKPEQE